MPLRTARPRNSAIEEDALGKARAKPGFGDAPGGTKEGHVALEGAKPNLQCACLEEQPLSLIELRSDVGGGNHLDTNFRRDQIGRIIGPGCAALARHPDDVGGLDSFFGLDGALDHAAPAFDCLPQDGRDFSLVFGVPAAGWRTHNNMAPAIALDAVRQRRQQFVLTDFGPSHAG